MARFNIPTGATPLSQLVPIVDTQGKVKSIVLQNVSSSDCYVSEDANRLQQTTPANLPAVGLHFPADSVPPWQLVIPRYNGKLYARSQGVGCQMEAIMSDLCETPQNSYGAIAAFILGLILALLLIVTPAKGQGSVTGQETPITYSGNVAVLAPPNTPANNFLLNGSNTFIVPVQPTVSIRVYITNNTANICSTFTLQVFAATDNQTNSFNNSLANWQVIPLQNPTGGLSAIINPLTVPASGAAYISSTAISATKVTIQLVNTASCASTNIEVTAVITSVSVQVPLVSTTSNLPSGVTNQVQGISSNGSASSLINPVLTSGAGPAVNGGFLTPGIDTFFPVTETVISQTPATPFAYGTVQQPGQKINEMAFAIYGGIGASCGISSFNSTWVLDTAIANGNNVGFTHLFPAVAGTTLQRINSNPSGCSWNIGKVVATIINLNATSFHQVTQSASPVGVLAGNNTAGDTILAVAACNTTSVCSVSSVTDTLSLGFKQLTFFQDASIAGSNINGLSVWVNTASNPGGADTVTFTGSNLASNFWVVTLSGITASSLVSPQAAIETDSVGAEVVRQDAIGANQVTCSVTLSTNTTSQLVNCGAATTINGVPARFYITDIQLNTTAAGTATTIQLVYGTGSNCASGTTNLTSMAYPNTVVGFTNIIGYRTPLISGQQTAICATQAGTTAGTTVVEVHGFLAP